MKIKDRKASSTLYTKSEILKNCEEFKILLKAISLNQLTDESIFNELNTIAEMILVRYESLQYEAY